MQANTCIFTPSSLSCHVLCLASNKQNKQQVFDALQAPKYRSLGSLTFCEVGEAITHAVSPPERLEDHSIVNDDKNQGYSVRARLDSESFKVVGNLR